MRKKIYVTRRIPSVGLKMLRNHFDQVEINPQDRPLTRKELFSAIESCDGILTQLVDQIDEPLLNKAKKLKVIANYAVGFDNINISVAHKRGIVVTNTPRVLTTATAELAWALLFSVARRFSENDSYMRKEKFKGWEPLLFLGMGVSGKTLGIVGAGRIGTAMAMMSKGFGMRVLYRSRKKNDLLEKELGAQRVELSELLKESDFVSLHVSLTPDTKYLIAKKELELMKPSSILINTSRGPVVNEKDLFSCLKEKKIFGAGLDVFEKEPLLTPGLVDLLNVALAAHVGSGTIQTREDMARLAAENIISVLEGKDPKTPIQ